jgi:hypothetical protein
MTKTIAKQFEQRFADIIDDMRDCRMACYEDSEGNHYIRFGDDSVIMEPENLGISFDEKAWSDYENAEQITECGHVADDERATAILKAALLG